MLFVLVPFEFSTSLLELDGALLFGIPFFFRLVGGLFSVFPVGVEAGRKEAGKEGSREGRKKRWVFPVPIFRLSLPCSRFLPRFGFSCSDSAIFNSC